MLNISYVYVYKGIKMFKKYAIFACAALLLSLPALADEPVFSQSGEVQKIDPAPVSSNSLDAVNVQKPGASSLSDQNFKSAINSLDTAQVEVREQLATYMSLMEQTKTEYEAKKAQYNQYKKEYNAIKKKMKNIDKMKKMLNDNLTVPVSAPAK